MARILLIDDDTVFRYAAAKHLTAAGHTVVEAADGMAALALLDAGSFELILADVVLVKGKPHGISVARMARLRDPGVPVIFLTGYPDLLADEGMPMFRKPVDMAALTEAIAARISQRTARDGRSI